MSELRNEIKRLLLCNFPKERTNIRETEKGFKFNVDKLDKHDIGMLYDLPVNNDIIIKRSGYGLVVIIE